MSKYKQDAIELGDMLCPRIEYQDKYYYPLSYMFNKVLLKGKQSVSLLKKNGYEDYLIQLEVDFSYSGGGVQNTYCISEAGLIKLLGKSYVGGLSVEQKQNMNCLLNYLGESLIDEKPRYKNTIDYKSSLEYDEFEKDCISETFKLFGILEWQKCTKCNKYYPVHGNFFRYNNHQDTFGTICRNCLNTDSRHMIAHPDSMFTKIYRKFGDEIYTYYKNHDTLNIYNHYIKNKISIYPKIIANKDDYYIIIKYLHQNKIINKSNITLSLLEDEHKLRRIKNCLTQEEIYNFLFPNRLPREYPWEYEKFILIKPTKTEMILVFNNYIKTHNIHINDIYKFDYYDIIKKSGLAGNYGDDLLYFVMKYYNDKYPAYKFSIASSNYWKKKEHRVQALKYLIEEDMKLELEKIPLYLTITSLQNIGTKTMYNVLKNYYSNLYEWVNEVYPDVFDPKDFDINYMRNEFDSLDEQSIHNILKENFYNVLYNPKHNEHTIKLLGKIPDWFIFTEVGVVIVEYFGLWAKERGMYNTRTRDYIIRSKDKIEKYKTLQGYRFLYIFPEDLENDYIGLHKKIDDIKNNKKLNIVG